MSNTATLNPEELMHLALHATQHETPDKAIDYLKRLLQIEPENGKAIYLLGALHAEIGMYEQAVEEMGRALEVEPNLPTARFQLGLLHLTSGNIAEAESVWAGLDVLGTEDPLFLFKTGMLHLVKDEFEECVSSLQAGIERNTLNEDLNNDMRRVIEDAQKAIAQTPVEAAEDTDSETGKHMLLSLYDSPDQEDS